MASLKGKTYEKIHGPEKAKLLREQRSKHFKKVRKGKSTWNKGLTKETDERVRKNAKAVSKSRIYTIEEYKEKYPTFIKEENPKFENGQIKVKCKFCDKYFTPTRSQLYERLRRFDRNYEVSGNSYFYCSEICKDKCEEFDRKVDPKQLEKFKRYSSLVHRETYKTLKKYFFKINNLNLRGNKYNYELDHIYSIYDGFLNNIPPNKIAHHKNLQVIPKQLNRSKSIHSTITLETLLSFK